MSELAYFFRDSLILPMCPNEHIELIILRTQLRKNGKMRSIFAFRFGIANHVTQQTTLQ